MHFLDAMWLYIPRDELFSDGWGDCDRVIETATPFLEPDEAQPLALKWAQPTKSWGIERRLGVAVSPCALAPAGVERLTVLRMTPARGQVRARVVVPPSWADAGFSMRTRLFAPLVQQGIELWLLEGAFFGNRRPSGQIGVGIRTVAELLSMGLCDLTELRGMVAAAREEEPKAPVVLAGFSMAGQFSAQVAATLVWDIPVVAMSPSDSPVAVFCEGPLSKSVAWGALGEGGRERLIPLLERFGIRSLAPPPSKKRILLATRHDGIVPPSAFERVAAHWRVEPRWLESGHLGAFMFNRAALRSAVLEVLG